MEIGEFLGRISLIGAEPTIFTLYEKGKNLTATGKELYFENRTIKTYTRTEDSMILGYLNYEKPFPKQIFAMDPTGLRNVLSESDQISIDGTYLVATGNMDFMWKLEVLDKSKTIEFQYKNPDITLSKEYVSKIIRAESIIKATDISVTSDGKDITFTLTERMSGKKAIVRVPFRSEPFEALYANRFIECLRLASGYDVLFNVDGRKQGIPDGVHGAGKIEIKESDARIIYYVSEVTRSVNEEKKTMKKEEQTEEPDEVEEENDLNDMEPETDDEENED